MPEQPSPPTERSVETVEGFLARLGGSRAKFLELYKDTPILLQVTQPEAGPKREATGRFGTMMIRRQDTVGSDMRLLVHPLVKAAAGNAFGMMITVGRAPNNDIILAYEGVSKFHAYFMKLPDGSWALVDAKSTNGTFLNGRRLVAEAKEKLDLARAIEVSFAESVTCRLYAPLAFLEHAMSLVKQGG